LRTIRRPLKSDSAFTPPADYWGPENRQAAWRPRRAKRNRWLPNMVRGLDLKDFWMSRQAEMKRARVSGLAAWRRRAGC
jgi:hypothetical protein